MGLPQLQVTPEEQKHRDKVMTTILSDVKLDRRIKLPDFDPLVSHPSESALLTVGLEPNAYNGLVSRFRYQFEGEEDLLHLVVTDREGLELSAEEGQAVAGFVLRGLPPALIWLRPGTYSQHFYFGHDELLQQLIV